MSLTIVEVIRRSDQGTTRPFLCRGDDGLLYFVKGRYAGRRALCCEWVAGSLGRFLGLPMPAFAMATVPADLIRYSATPDIADLGTGPVFASQLVEDAQELTVRYLRRVDLVLQALVLLFDWWVHNEDRTLTDYGGNPNLLWSLQGGGLQVFDQNLAFDESFDAGRFWSNHVFAAAVSGWTADFCEAVRPRLESAVAELPRIWENLPADWLHADADTSLPPALPRESVERILSRFRQDPKGFWKVRT